MMPVSGSIATPQTAGGPTPSDPAKREFVGGTNWPESTGDVGLDRSRETIPCDIHAENARFPSTSVLWMFHVPGGTSRVPDTYGRSFNMPTWVHSTAPSPSVSDPTDS